MAYSNWKAMCRREAHKVDIEVKRWGLSGAPRQHIPVRYRLEDDRWQRKTNVRLSRPHKR